MNTTTTNFYMFLHACCLFFCRYMLDPRKKPHVKIQPPFIRPDLSDRQITIKVSDNGIHNTIISSKVSFQQSLRIPLLFSSYSIIQLTYIKSLFCGICSIFSLFYSHSLMSQMYSMVYPQFCFSFPVVIQAQKATN